MESSGRGSDADDVDAVVTLLCDCEVSAAVEPAAD